MFILNTSEVKTYYKNTTFIMKNCSLEAKSVVSLLEIIYNDLAGGNTKDSDFRRY